MAWEHKSNRHLVDDRSSVNERSLVVMANTLARKATQWNAMETKLFFCALSQIPNMDSDGWVTMEKSEVKEAAKIDDSRSLRDLFQKVKRKSAIHFGNDEVWEDGDLIRFVKSTRSTVSVQFEEKYFHLLKELHTEFIKLQLRNVNGMKSKYSIALYLDLKSHYDPRHTIMHWTYSLEEIKTLFNISKTDYVRKDGKFKMSDFYKYTLAVAEREINAPGTGMRIQIETLHKNGKSNGYVLGYDISFVIYDNTGEVISGSDESDEE